MNKNARNGSWKTRSAQTITKQQSCTGSRARKLQKRKYKRKYWKNLRRDIWKVMLLTTPSRDKLVIRKLISFGYKKELPAVYFYGKKKSSA